VLCSNASTSEARIPIARCFPIRMAAEQFQIRPAYAPGRLQVSVQESHDGLSGRCQFMFGTPG
jgi:hypothetical protein